MEKTEKILLMLVFIVYTLSYSQEPAIFRLAGYANENGETTGGQGGAEITVSTGTDLQQALKNQQDSITPLTIYINGTITPDNSPGLSKIDIKDLQDVSIIGIDTLGEFHGIGIKIWKASNVIVRNLKVHHVLIGDKDCIGIEGPSDHIWIDHCEIYNEYQEVDKDYYDGLLDAKKDCEYITYSWNYLHDSWKTALCGSSESDDYDRKLTMHHNFFENCNSRLPLYRGGVGHFFNNYYKDIASTAINSRINACVKIENNYFLNTLNPWVSAYSDVLGGGDVSGNELVNSLFDFSRDDTHELPACTLTVPYEYNDVLDDALNVPDIVIAYAGVGKINNPNTTPFYKLTKSIEGIGSIILNPDKTIYDSGDVVTVTALPEANWEFNGWSGDLSGSEDSLVITMNTDKNITATFSEILYIYSSVNDSYELTIFPNPVNDYANILVNSEKTQNAQISIINIAGSKYILHNGLIYANTDFNIRIDANSYKPGMYFIEMITNNRREVHKLILNQ